MIDAADAIGFDLHALEAHGYAELERRVAHAHEQFVAGGKYAFRQRDAARRVANVVKFRWEMVERESGFVAAVGLEILVLDSSGRIVSDHQFIET
jgi:hypothetical protein